MASTVLVTLRGLHRSAVYRKTLYNAYMTSLVWQWRRILQPSWTRSHTYTKELRLPWHYTNVSYYSVKIV